jgi:hypothetical protein
MRSEERLACHSIHGKNLMKCANNTLLSVKKARLAMLGHCCIQHLAAIDIARTIAETQGSTFRLFVQDIHYAQSYKDILEELEPTLIMVDHTFADGLNLVDDRSFIVCFDSKAVILEPAIPIVGLNGPAGMLVNPVLENVEEKWNGK